MGEDTELLPMFSACRAKMAQAKMARAAGNHDIANALAMEAHQELVEAQERELPIMLVEHPRWSWMEGMRLGQRGTPYDRYRLISLPAHGRGYSLADPGECWDMDTVDHLVPVLDDAGTQGALWHMLRSHLREHRPAWSAAWTDGVVMWDRSTGATVFDGPLVAALLLAWEDRRADA